MKLRYFTLAALAAIASFSYAQAKKPAKKPAATVKTVKNETMSAKAKAIFEDMLSNTQKVFVIDSTVVDKDNVLSVIPLPKAYGSFVDYDTLFGMQTGTKNKVFVNGFGSRCYYTETGADNVSRLYMRDKLGENWSKPIAIKEINDNFTDICYPYMSSDGQTLYFAGKSEEQGLGHRDIYMTKYDADNGTFMLPENIGLPFNSAADDYAFVIADADHMAWFATTRRQPEGKACVYAFVPAETRKNYDADDMEDSKLMSLAELKSIRDTWTNKDERAKAVARLERLIQNAEKEASGTKPFAFVVDDNNTYTNVSQFRSDETRKAFYELRRLQTDLSSTLSKIEGLRTDYHNAKDKAPLGNKIAALEKKADTTRANIKNAEQQLRIKESKLIKNK